MENTNCLLQVLRHYPNWVQWKYELAGGQWKKPPYQLRTGRQARTTVPAHWCPYSDWFAVAFKQLGFVLSRECNLICIDIDNKKNDPALYDLHRRILADFNDTYIEYSPRGNGVHIWCYGPFAKNGHRPPNTGVELYCHVRFMTLTFNPLRNVPLTDGTERVLRWIAELVPSEKHTVTKIVTWLGGGVVNGVNGASHPNIYDLRNQPETLSDVYILRSFIARRDYEKCALLHSGNWQAIKNGDGKQRYGTQSEADQAFCNVIAFYTDDPVQVAKVFMHSRLSWNINRHSPQYLWRTIQTAFDMKGGA